MSMLRNRREFIRDLGIGAAAVPFLSGLPGLARAAEGAAKQRLVVMFSPNGTVPWNFWPDEEGADFKLKEILTPLAPFKDRTLVLHGLNQRVKGDGDGHMRGIGCLLTGIELYPGNILGGSHTPAGWASGLSIDQEIANLLQSKPETRTRLGSLVLGVFVPDRADTWSRMSYAGPNKPIAPLSDPYQTLKKLYGEAKDREALKSILDDVREDLAKAREKLGAEDRRLLEQHEAFVREMEEQLKAESAAKAGPPAPELPAGVREDNDNMPRLSRMQIDLLVHSFQADFARVATLQYTASVGQSRMKWLGVDERHHELSHKPDKDKEAQDQLTRINKWFCGELAYLAKKLADTPEPGGEGSMLDHTTIVWTNELGQGNSHTHNNIPFVTVGGGLGWKTGRSLKLKGQPHNRFLLSLAHGFGHRIETFGNKTLCAGGPIPLG